jgi:hypothetical protein
MAFDKSVAMYAFTASLKNISQSLMLQKIKVTLIGMGMRAHRLSIRSKQLTYSGSDIVRKTRSYSGA